MSSATRSFAFCEANDGNWIAEECIFSEEGCVNYTLRAKTKLVVLEIAAADLKHLLIQDYKEYLLQLSLNKHVLLLQRMQSIIQSSKHMHRRQDFKFFYDQTLRTMVALHPMAN